eukprot:TRINITY_DN1362_c0_g1_i1.p3 TRINITY_DN1362_c0_g1~~TRINITY_DN1362_c0_g1_i1.p3  ORF type:complete len:94 (+),score=11.11 TRINITY_DN1362_c0_g1_i1:50-331(+)
MGTPPGSPHKPRSPPPPWPEAFYDHPPKSPSPDPDAWQRPPTPDKFDEAPSQRLSPSKERFSPAERARRKVFATAKACSSRLSGLRLIKFQLG